MPSAHNVKLFLFQKNFVTILNICTFWDVIDLLVLEKKFENLNLFSFFLNYVPFKRSWPFSRTSLKSLHKKTKQIKQNYAGLNWLNSFEEVKNVKCLEAKGQSH